MNFKKLAVAAAALSFAFSAFAAGIPAQKLDKSLHAKLPASIQKSGVLRDAVNGSFPPYYVVTDSGRALRLLEGAWRDSRGPG